MGENPLETRPLISSACCCELAQICLATAHRLRRPLAVRHFGDGDCNSMRQSLGINPDVTLDARDLLARVIPLASCRIRVLHALRVHEQ